MPTNWGSVNSWGKSVRSVSFGILGPLEVVGDGKSVKIGNNRQRVILAMLVVNPNRTVSTRQLVNAVWSDDPPKTAVEQVQTCVWRLRKSFDAVFPGRRLIETTASGYSLRLGESTVDTEEFDERVREAKSMAGSGEHDAAARRFREALDLFRGPVLAEIGSPLVRAVAAKWEERRLVVHEECLESELASGRHSEVVDELTALVNEHPLREVLRGQLMLAPYRCGRQADALGVFREGRDIMIWQLGIEPGQRLQELHGAILASGGTTAGRSGAAFVDAVSQQCQSQVARSLLTELAVEQLEIKSVDDPRYVSAVIARLQEGLVSRQIADIKSKVQRMSPLDDAEEYNALFGDLVALEGYRKALLEQAMGGME